MNLELVIKKDKKNGIWIMEIDSRQDFRNHRIWITSENEESCKLNIKENKDE